MFKMVINRLPWRGAEIKARLIAEHRVGIRALAEFVAERARVYCPVDTGELRASIQVISEADGMRHHVVATARHAEAQEFGFRHHRSGKFIAPRMYMRKAVRDGANALPRFLGNARVNQGFHHGRLMGATFE